MNSRVFGRCLWAAGAFIVGLEAGSGQPPFTLEVRRDGGRAVLEWPASLTGPQPSPVNPEYTIYRSTNLAHWAPVGGKVRAMPGRSGPTLSVYMGATGSAQFYRVRAD